jgi:hypothetical protein
MGAATNGRPVEAGQKANGKAANGKAINGKAKNGKASNGHAISTKLKTSRTTKKYGAYGIFSVVCRYVGSHQDVKAY